MIVVIEGVDAAGKSTLCKNLARLYGGIVYSTPPQKIREARISIDHFATPLESFQFYSNGIEIAAREILELQGKFSHIFIDRYWISTVATHMAMGVDVDIDLLAGFECADVTILLTIAPIEQARRFEQRGMTTGDRNLTHFFQRIDTNFRNLVRIYCPSYVMIDTSDRSAQNTLACAVGQLRQYFT